MCVNFAKATNPKTNPKTLTLTIIRTLALTVTLTLTLTLTLALTLTLTPAGAVTTQTTSNTWGARPPGGRHFGFVDPVEVEKIAALWMS